jgi:hypothetical protein
MLQRFRITIRIGGREAGFGGTNNIFVNGTVKLTAATALYACFQGG